MRNNLLLLVGVMLLPLLGSWMMGHARPSVSNPVVQTQETKAQPLPEFQFFDLHGIARGSDEFKGKILLLNFWASWCIPCVHEFPALLDIAKAHKDIKIVALSLDDRTATAEKFLRKFGKLPDNFTVGLDKGQKISHDLFESVLVPETIIVTPGGMMHGKIAGGDWAPADMESQIKAAISTK